MPQGHFVVVSSSWVPLLCRPMQHTGSTLLQQVTTRWDHLFQKERKGASWWYRMLCKRECRDLPRWKRRHDLWPESWKVYRNALRGRKSRFSCRETDVWQPESGRLTCSVLCLGDSCVWTLRWSGRWRWLVHKAIELECSAGVGLSLLPMQFGRRMFTVQSERSLWHLKWENLMKTWKSPCEGWCTSMKSYRKDGKGSPLQSHVGCQTDMQKKDEGGYNHLYFATSKTLQCRCHADHFTGNKTTLHSLSKRNRTRALRKHTQEQLRPLRPWEVHLNEL